MVLCDDGYGVCDDGYGVSDDGDGVYVCVCVCDNRCGVCDNVYAVCDRQLQEEVKMSLEDAIRLVQIHERARQGRLRAKFMREIRQQEEREKKAALRGAPTLDPEVASVRIQKVSPTITLC